MYKSARRNFFSLSVKFIPTNVRFIDGVYLYLINIYGFIKIEILYT